MAYTDRTIPSVTYTPRSGETATYGDRGQPSLLPTGYEVRGEYYLLQQVQYYLLNEDGHPIVIDRTTYSDDRESGISYTDRTVPTVTYTDR